MGKKDQIIVITLSFLHLICDLICGFKIVGVLGTEFIEYSLYIFIIYNSLAFCFQPFIGLVVDKFHIEKYVLLISVPLILFGVIVNNWIISSILLGIANQFFHVSGGKVCTNIDTKKATHLGLFVSLGAVGLMIGSNFYSYGYILLVAVILYILLTIAIYPFIEVEQTMIKQEDHKKFKYQKWFVITFLVLIVFIRSFVGKIIHFDFDVTLTVIIASAIAAAFGKFIGGVLRDFFGSFKTISISLGLCAVILIFLDFSVAMMIIGIILINISMPITLFELNRINKNYEGLNFGLLAATLFPGVVLGLVYPYSEVTYIPIVIICMLLSIYGIYYVVKVFKYD